MPEESLKTKVAKGSAWILLEKLSGQTVRFVVGMVLARLLTPNDFGTVALYLVFFNVTSVLVDGGFGSALIQKKDADDLDFNSVFYLVLFLSVLAYVAIFFAAPAIASFYKLPELTFIVRIAAIAFFFQAINSIQNAELTKKMLFHLSFRISLITTFASAIIGVTLALLGYGVWALVCVSLTYGFVGFIARWFIIAWRPRLMFSFARLRKLFAFGWKMAASTLLDSIFHNLNGLIIGRLYSKADLAYVNKGQALPELAMNEVDATLGLVSFPALVQLQDDKVRLREAMRQMMRCSTFLVFPLMVGVAACAKSELRLLYGAQWLPAAPYMMLACFSFALTPFNTINLRGIMVLGRSDICLILELIKKGLALLVIICAARLGVFTWMAISAFTLGPIGVLINAWPNRKLLGYSLGMQLRDVLPTALVCVAEAVVVFGIDFVADLVAPRLDIGNAGPAYLVFLATKLLLQFVFGAGTFFGLAYLFRLRPMGEYVRLGSVTLGGCFSRIAWKLEKRFAHQFMQDERCSRVACSPPKKPS